MFESATTTDIAAIGWAGRNTNGVGRHWIRSEVGHESAVGIHGEGVVGIIGNYGAVFGPILKGIAIVGCGSHGAGFTLFESATTTDIAAIGWAG